MNSAVVSHQMTAKGLHKIKKQTFICGKDNMTVIYTIGQVKFIDRAHFIQKATQGASQGQERYYYKDIKYQQTYHLVISYSP